jgi:hypothetical protein
MFRRVTFSDWTVITGSRLRRMAAVVNPASTRPMAEKTRILRRFLFFGFAICVLQKTPIVSGLFQIKEPERANSV